MYSWIEQAKNKMKREKRPGLKSDAFLSTWTTFLQGFVDNRDLLVLPPSFPSIISLKRGYYQQDSYGNALRQDPSLN
jgi:hypothetical protein